MTDEPEFRWVHIKGRDELETFYRGILPKIRNAARLHGYAIGVHGSMRRDFDLIAVPWADGHSDKDALAVAVHMAACGLQNHTNTWEAKPCGRFATSLPICWIDWKDAHAENGCGHIDLSVMSGTGT